MSGCQSAEPASILKSLVKIEAAAHDSIFNACDNLAINGAPIRLCDRLEPLVQFIGYILHRNGCHFATSK
jgi:hypothetical protein